MSTVVKTLKSLTDLKDIPIGPFVYIVPPEGKEENGKEGQIDCQAMVIYENKGEEEEVGSDKVKGSHRRPKGQRRRYRIKSLKSSTVHSDRYCSI